MSIKIPSNQIQESKYTAGEELIVESTNATYKGYYCEFNNTLYAGRTYTIASPKLLKIENRNTLLSKGTSTALYSLVSGTSSNSLSTSKIPSIPTSIYSKDIELTFYYRKINETSIIIKQINETTYQSIKPNPLYQTTYIGKYQGKTQTIDDAEKQLPGMKAFLG
jgi:hypothetical protein